MASSCLDHLNVFFFLDHLELISVSKVKTARLEQKYNQEQQ